MEIDSEPTLRELLTDPLLHAMMARDGVDYMTLLGVIDDARARLGLPVVADEATLSCLFEATALREGAPELEPSIAGRDTVAPVY